MSAPEVEAFLTHLAVKESDAALTQNQALRAFLFLYREVLHQDLAPVCALRAKRPKRLPTVPTQDETLRLIGLLSGTHQLMAKGRPGRPQPLGFTNYRGWTWPRIAIATVS